MVCFDDDDTRTLFQKNGTRFLERLHIVRTLIASKSFILFTASRIIY